jgi:hypothetical protein
VICDEAGLKQSEKRINRLVNVENNMKLFTPPVTPFNLEDMLATLMNTSMNKLSNTNLPQGEMDTKNEGPHEANTDLALGPNRTQWNWVDLAKRGRNSSLDEFEEITLETSLKTSLQTSLEITKRIQTLRTLMEIRDVYRKNIGKNIENSDYKIVFCMGLKNVAKFLMMSDPSSSGSQGLKIVYNLELARQYLGLHQTAANGQYRLLSFLLKHISKHNQSLIDLAPGPNRDMRRSEVELALGSIRTSRSEVDTKYREKTPLHYAAQYGHAKCIKILLKYGANIEERDALENTPLLLAISCPLYRKSYASIKTLIRHGANLDVSNLKGYSLLQYVLEYNFLQNSFHYAFHERNSKLVQLLLKWGANPFVRFTASNTGLNSPLDEILPRGARLTQLRRISRFGPGTKTNIPYTCIIYYRNVYLIQLLISGFNSIFKFASRRISTSRSEVSLTSSGLIWPQGQPKHNISLYTLYDKHVWRGVARYLWEIHDDKNPLS